jgi:hypothetical protein
MDYLTKLLIWLTDYKTDWLDWGGRPLHKVQFLIFRNLSASPVARSMNSSPKAFLCNPSDALSILSCSCHLVPGRISCNRVSCTCHFCTVGYLTAGDGQFLRNPQFPWVRIFLKTVPLRRATAARQDTFLQAAANFLRDPQSPWVNSFGSSHHPAASIRPLCRFFHPQTSFTTASS